MIRLDDLDDFHKQLENDNKIIYRCDFPAKVLKSYGIDCSKSDEELAVWKFLDLRGRATIRKIL